MGGTDPGGRDLPQLGNADPCMLRNRLAENESDKERPGFNSFVCQKPTELVASHSKLVS